MFCLVCRQNVWKANKMYNSFIVGTKNLKLGAIKDDDSSKCHMPNIVDMFFHMRLHAAS